MSWIAEKTFNYNITRFQINVSRISSVKVSLNHVCAKIGLVFVFQLQREQESRFRSLFSLNLGIISYPWLPRPYFNSLVQDKSGFDWKRWLHRGKLIYIYFWFDYENTSDWRSHLSRLISYFKIQTSKYLLYIVQHLFFFLHTNHVSNSLYILICFWYASSTKLNFLFVFFYELYILWFSLLIWCEYFF